MSPIAERQTRHAGRSLCGLLIALLAMVAIGSLPAAASADGASADSGGDSAIPQLLNQVPASVQFDTTALTVTFGPVDLGHKGDAAAHAPVPAFSFVAPTDLTIIGYRVRVRTRQGDPLPRSYLHHFSISDATRSSTFCEGAPYLLVGSGVELTDAMFPAGYGLTVKEGARLLAVSAFYHDLSPSTGVLAELTMLLAPEGSQIEPLDTYLVSVTSDCYTRYVQASGETEEGLRLEPGIVTRSVPVSFPFEGCIKYAYSHLHDFAALLTLSNQSRRQTLLRTVPDLSLDGRMRGIPQHQVYSDRGGLSVNAEDRYELSMIYYRPLQTTAQRYGMGMYILYLTRSPCSTTQGTASSR